MVCRNLEIFSGDFFLLAKSFCVRSLESERDSPCYTAEKAAKINYKQDRSVLINSFNNY